MNTYRYVVVGNSAGGIAAVRTIRKSDRDGSILLVSEEPYVAYSRPLIAKRVSERRDVTHMSLIPPGFYSEYNVHVRLGARAAGLCTDGHSLEFADGQVVRYDRLLLATGSAPITPPIEGSDREGVFTFTTYDDATAIDAALDSVQHVVVIGAGFIGLSAADALAKRGVAVTIVEMQDHVLSGMLDSVASTLVEDAARASGVSVLTGRRVLSINGDMLSGRRVSSVTLDGATRLSCEMVIMAVGVHARTELGRDQIRIGRGFIVDREMKTSADDVFACGDAAEVFDYARGKGGIVAVWPNAVAGGTIAGANMAGDTRTYAGATTLNALPYFGLSVGSAGVLDGSEEQGFECVVHRSGRVYRKVILRNGLVAGMVFTGDTSKCGLIYNLMRNGIEVGPWKDALVSDSFGLLSLPPELWHEQLTGGAECPRAEWETD